MAFLMVPKEQLTIKLHNASQALHFGAPLKTSPFQQAFLDAHHKEVGFLEVDKLMFLHVSATLPGRTCKLGECIFTELFGMPALSCLPAKRGGRQEGGGEEGGKNWVWNWVIGGENLMFFGWWNFADHPNH